MSNSDIEVSIALIWGFVIPISEFTEIRDSDVARRLDFIENNFGLLAIKINILTGYEQSGPRRVIEEDMLFQWATQCGAM